LRCWEWVACASSCTILEPPHIEVYASDTEMLKLWTGEARALGELVLEIADIAEAD
jgi:hypothetical protein